MSDVNPTNSKSYRPGDEEKGYNDLVTIVLTTGMLRFIDSHE